MSELETLTAALADRYTIEREIGAGGMATVYLARDLKHDRRVALKVLKPELGAVLGVERFLNEIKTTANLQHPHILPLFDSGAVNDTVFYAMPFVDGETLRDRLTREKQLPIDDALRIAREAADALQYAHERGVIHRDIKPENILLQGGHALVADFGIALAASSIGGARMTETGMSLGTPRYMSPEQAMGERTLDARTDVYALGCVLYEMLVGDPPFTGSTAQAIVARVITGTPESLTAQRSTIPMHVEAAVMTALAKLPADRFATAATFANALTNQAYATSATRAGVAAVRPSTQWKRLAIASTGVAFASLAAMTWFISHRATTTSSPVLRVSLELPDSLGFATGRGTVAAISPDGSTLAFLAGPLNSTFSRIWIRRRDQLELKPIPGLPANISLPFFSPDGRRVGFVDAVAHRLMAVDLDGGIPVVLADTALDFSDVSSTPSWERDGFVYASARARLYRVRVPGGATTAISTINAATHEDRHVSPTLLPNGRGVLFTIQYVPNSNIDLYEVAVLDIASGKHHVLMKGVAARFTNDRIVVVRANGELVSTPFDQEKLIVTGPPVIVQTGVAVEGTFGTVSIAIADDGTLAYMPGLSVGGSASLTWVSRSGAESPVDTGWKADFRSASLSPDGTRMAATIADQTHEDVWIKELATGPQAKAKITLDRGLHQRASWSADGQRVLFLDATTFPSVLKSARTDGIGRAELVAGESRSISQGFASADGKWIFYRTSSSSMGHGDILARRVGDSVSVPLLATDADERHPSLSPNGKWLAYRSDESGRSEVYVRPFPDVNQRKWLVSTAGGTDPVWGRSGKELFFINNANDMIAAAVETGTTFSVRGLSRLFALPTGIRSYVSSQRFDVSMDDSRFLMIRSENTGARSRDQLMYVTNWFTELRALTDKAKR